jgi:hypothetical protein
MAPESWQITLSAALDALRRDVRHGDYLELIVFLLVAYIPFLPVVVKEWRHRKEVRELSEARLGDKDGEI